MNKLKILGSAMLIAGTTIGAGMLGLPLVTGYAGFVPAVLLILIYGAVMLYTSFLTLEAVLWSPPDANFMTIAENTIGKWGKTATWILYLFLLYALTTAYMAGLHPLMLDFVHCLFDWHPPSWTGYLPILLLFGFFIYRGTRWVDHANRWMMVGLVLTFGFILIFLSPAVEPSLLSHRQWGALPLSFSILATSFGCHIVLPSIATYMHRDARACRIAVWIGATLPILVYIIWQWLSLGIIPLDRIQEAVDTGSTSGELMADIVSFAPLKGALRLFTFFLIITSFLGVSLSLFDFLADGLKIKKTRLGKGALFLLTFLPPLVICLANPAVFLSALDYAGAYGVIGLLCIIPSLFILYGRKKFAKATSYQVPLVKAVIPLVFLFSAVVILNEFLHF